MLNRVVIDTNVLVSAVLLPLSTPRRAVDKALDRHLLLFSEATLAELAQVNGVGETKLARYGQQILDVLADPGIAPLLARGTAPGIQ